MEGLSVQSLKYTGCMCEFLQGPWGLPMRFPAGVGIQLHLHFVSSYTFHHQQAPAVDTPPHSCLLLVFHCLDGGLPGPSPGTLLSAQWRESGLLPDVLFSSSCHPSIHFSLVHRKRKGKAASSSWSIHVQKENGVWGLIVTDTSIFLQVSILEGPLFGFKEVQKTSLHNLITWHKAVATTPILRTFSLCSFPQPPAYMCVEELRWRMGL